MIDATIIPFPSRATLDAIRRLRDNVIDLSIAQDDARAEFLRRLQDWDASEGDDPEIDAASEWLDTVTQQLARACDELARLIGRTGDPAA
jgi:hypothetical protein